MEISVGSSSSTGAPGWRFAVSSGILGWVLDAFDFFVVVFLIDELGARYHVGKPAILATIGIVLFMRPIGALLFGTIADKYGRKGPLIACVAYFSGVSVCSGFAPTYALFFIFRALYGIGMGGYWGIGASLRDGVLSGFQARLSVWHDAGGYPFGYLLAAVAMQFIPPHFGWHAMFFIGSFLAVAIIIITLFAPESDAWKESRQPSLGHIFRALWAHMGTFSYLLILMAVMSCLSHGTQDLYPNFLKGLPFIGKSTIIGMKPNLGIPVIYNIGAIVGAVLIGQLSQKIGRRKAIMMALGISLLSMPAWAFGGTVLVLVFGAFAMQFGVQGAFGVIPAHLNELSPDSIRGLFPGFVYQLGVLIASPVLNVQDVLRSHLGYSWALTSFELCVIVLLMLIFGFGPEKHGKAFQHSEARMVTDIVTPTDPELDPTTLGQRAARV